MSNHILVVPANGASLACQLCNIIQSNRHAGSSSHHVDFAAKHIKTSQFH